MKNLTLPLPYPLPLTIFHSPGAGKIRTLPASAATARADAIAALPGCLQQEINEVRANADNPKQKAQAALNKVHTLPNTACQKAANNVAVAAILYLPKYVL